MPCVKPDPENKDAEPFVEVDPTGRYGRYDDLLGAGAVKRVYRGFDQEEGIEVAWNQVRLRSFSEDRPMLDRLFAEVRLLRTLRHENIIALYSVWTDDECSTLNFITEVCTSGNLREYRKRHRHVSLMALKKWSRQILMGLEYLHNHEPCVIHRDLNCSNVFINGNIGQVKIGDLGLAAIVGKSHAAHSILGTPEFMAPELYEEDYTELVDIYSFGMCVLEMVTREIPYSECDSVAKIYRKVTAGVRPASLAKIGDLEVKAFIERCLAKPRARPSASELLMDPFFDGLDEDVLTPAPLPSSPYPSLAAAAHPASGADRIACLRCIDRSSRTSTNSRFSIRPVLSEAPEQHLILRTSTPSAGRTPESRRHPSGRRTARIAPGDQPPRTAPHLCSPDRASRTEPSIRRHP